MPAQCGAACIADLDHVDRGKDDAQISRDDAISAVAQRRLNQGEDLSLLRRGVETANQLYPGLEV